MTQPHSISASRVLPAAARLRAFGLRRALLVAALPLASFVTLAGLAGCPSPESRSESIDPVTLPVEVRADYEIFAARCSKCHALSRPLNSGIVDDDYWSLYVARMRRQPGSGISVDDSRVILRFLHYYSLEQIRKKQARAAEQAASPLAPPPPAPLPATAPVAVPIPDAG
jgi:hypothetical protein